MKTAEHQSASKASPSRQSQPFFNKGGRDIARKDQDLFFNRSPVQAKLSVGQPNDKYEQEADAMADKVVQRLSSGDSVQTKPEFGNSYTPYVQMKCEACKEEDKLQKKEDDPEREKDNPELQLKPIFESENIAGEEQEKIQRKCKECEEENKLQKMEMAGSTGNIDSGIENRLSSTKGSGSPLSPEIQSRMESSFGADFSNVRIHNNSTAVQLSDDLHAQAFTHENDIYFNSGKYDINAPGGQHLLAHELTHTIQQGKSPSVSLRRKPNTGLLSEPVITKSNTPTGTAIASVPESKIQTEEDQQVDLLKGKLQNMHLSGGKAEPPDEAGNANLHSSIQKKEAPQIQKEPATEDQKKAIADALAKLGIKVDETDKQAIHDQYPNGIAPERQITFVQVSGNNYSSIAKLSAVRLTPATALQPQVELFIFEVGKGRSILVSSTGGGGSVLLDAGAGGANTSNSMAARVLATHINNLTLTGITSAPTTIKLSHVDADHYNALSSVLNLPQMGTAVVELTRQQLNQAISQGNWRTMNVQIAPAQRIVQLNVSGSGLDVRREIIGNMEITEFRSQAAHTSLTTPGQTRLNKNNTSPVTIIRDRVSNTTYVTTGDAEGRLLNDVVNMVGEDAFRRMAGGGGGARNIAAVEFPHHGGAVNRGPDVNGMVRFLRIMFEGSNGTVNFFAQTSQNFANSPSASVRYLDTADINVERIMEDPAGVTGVRNIRGRINTRIMLNGGQISSVLAIGNSNSSRIMEAYQLRDKILTTSENLQVMEATFRMVPGIGEKLSGALGNARAEIETHQTNLNTRLNGFWGELNNSAQATGMRASANTAGLQTELTNLDTTVKGINIQAIENSLAEIKNGISLMGRVFLNSLSMQQALRLRNLAELNTLKGEQRQLVNELLKGARAELGQSEFHRQIRATWQEVRAGWNQGYIQRVAMRMGMQEADTKRMLFRSNLAINLSRQMQLNDLAKKAHEGTLPRTGAVPARTRGGASFMAAIELLRLGLEFYQSYEAGKEADEQRERENKIQGLREVYWWENLGVKPQIKLVGTSWGSLKTLDISNELAYKVINEAIPEAERPEYSKVVVADVSDEDLQTVVAQFYLRYMTMADWIEDMGDPQLNDRMTVKSSSRWFVKADDGWRVKLWDKEDNEYKLSAKTIIQAPLEQLMVHLKAGQEDEFGNLKKENETSGTYSISDSAWVFGTDRIAWVYNSFGNPKELDFDDFKPVFVKISKEPYAYRIKGDMVLVRAANMETYKRLTRYYWVKASDEDVIDRSGQHRNYYVLNNSAGYAYVDESELFKQKAPAVQKTETGIAEQTDNGISLQRAPIIKNSCPEFESDEIQKSHTQKGILNQDALIPGFMSLMSRQNDLVIVDFGVDWGSVKDSTRNEPFLQQWINAFESNPDYWLEIEGFSDCSGFEQHNLELRHRRAFKVYQMLDKARSRVKFYKAAPVNEYISGNENMEGRAMNRGVAIHFGRSFDFTGETIEGNRPKPPKPKPEKPPEKADTTDCDQNQKDALTRGFNLAKKMVYAALGEIENDTLLKKYFGTDALKHRYHIKQNFVSIKDGLNSEPTFECEKPDSFWCDGAVAMVIPVAGLNIHICPAAISQGDDFLARTIVHEAGHRYAFIFMPDDLCVGGWPSDRDTTDAEDNADCYGEFAGDALTI